MSLSKSKPTFYTAVPAAVFTDAFNNTAVYDKRDIPCVADDCLMLGNNKVAVFLLSGGHNIQ